MLMYCDHWPKELKIEQQTGLLLANLRYVYFSSCLLSNMDAFGMTNFGVDETIHSTVQDDDRVLLLCSCIYLLHITFPFPIEIATCTLQTLQLLHFSRALVCLVLTNYKFDNLQYNTLVCLADGTNDSSTKPLTFQVFFYKISYRLRELKTLYFHFCIYVKKNKVKKN